jgi:CRP/FNR family cyclic AMP-dependent transcriptional regulator
VFDEKRITWYLKRVPFLTDLDPAVIQRFAESVEMKEVRRRQVLYLPGDPGGAVFLVNGGRVKVSKVTRDGKELTLGYRAPGELFGEACLIDGSPRQEMAEAVENVMVSEIPRERFEAIIAASAELGVRLVKMMAMRRLELENNIEKLVFRDVNSKLAELLQKLAAEYGVDDSRGTLIALKITHQEMANLIGSTRETVSLTLAQFKRKGLITNDGRKLIVVDNEGLKALA